MKKGKIQFVCKFILYRVMWKKEKIWFVCKFILCRVMWKKGKYSLFASLFCTGCCEKRGKYGLFASLFLYRVMWKKKENTVCLQVYKILWQTECYQTIVGLYKLEHFVSVEGITDSYQSLKILELPFPTNVERGCSSRANILKSGDFYNCIKNYILFYMTPCSLVDKYQRFGCSCWICFQNVTFF